MPHRKRIGYKLSAEDSAAQGSPAPAPRNDFSRRPTTDIRIQSLLHRDLQQLNAQDRVPTLPELRQPSLDEQTSPSFSPARHRDDSQHLDVAALLARIAAVDGFRAGAVLDAEWGELLASSCAEEGIDIELAAHLSFTSLPTRAYAQPLCEIATTSAAHYELTSIVETPFLSLVLFTVWDRSRTNFALAHMEISAALATCNNKRAILTP